MDWMRKRSRVIARVALFAIAWPWLLLAGSGSATAVVLAVEDGSHGWQPWATTIESTTVGDIGLPDLGKCSGHWFGVDVPGSGARVDVTGACWGWPDFTPGWQNEIEPGAPYSWEVRNSSDSDCASGTSTFGDHPDDGFSRTAGKITFGAVGMDTTTCMPVKVCLKLDNSTSENWGCFAVEVEENTPTNEECIYGTPSVTLSTGPGEPPVYADYHARVTEIQVTVVKPNTGDQSAPAGSYWQNWQYHSVTGAQVQNGALGPDVSTGGVWRNGPTHHGVNGEGWIGTNMWRSRESPGSGNAYLNTQLKEPFGVWIWPTTPASPTRLFPPAGLEGGKPHSEYQWGDNDPANCHFYFGPKFRDDPNSTLDDPQGSLNAPPPPTEPPPPPEPPTEEPPAETEWWLTLWQLLKQIIEALVSIAKGIASLAVKIVNGVGELLSDLFIPTGDGIDVVGLHDQIGAKPPFSLVDDVSTQLDALGSAFSSSGECGVLATFGNTTISCASIRSAPGMGALYSLVQWGLVGVTAWGAFNRLTDTIERGQ